MVTNPVIEWCIPLLNKQFWNQPIQYLAQPINPNQLIILLKCAHSQQNPTSHTAVEKKEEEEKK